MLHHESSSLKTQVGKVILKRANESWKCVKNSFLVKENKSKKKNKKEEEENVAFKIGGVLFISVHKEIIINDKKLSC